MEDNSSLKTKESSSANFYNVDKLRKRGIKNFLEKARNKYKNKTIKYNIISNNKKENNNNIKKIRNPGVDFARMISMYIVVVTHYFYYGKPTKHFPKYARQLSLLECITDWHNDAFVLISGMVGYKTNKYSNLIYLWLTVFFYSVGIHKYYEYFKKGYFIYQDIVKELFPIVFRRYWFFTTYFGMYLFLPVINKGIASLTKYELRLVVITTIFIFVFWREYKNPSEDIFVMVSGASIAWFLTLYLTGAYIGKYRSDYFGIKKYILCFIYLFIFSIVSILYFKSYIKEYYLTIGNWKIQFPIVLKRMINGRYDSIIKVIQSITACLFCLQIYYNKYIAKIICFFGPLLFGVYLFHMHYLIKRNIVMHSFDNISTDKSLNSVVVLIFGKSFKLFIICIIIDYIRNLLFSLLRIKKILIFIETKMKDKLG